MNVDPDSQAREDAGSCNGWSSNDPCQVVGGPLTQAVNGRDNKLKPMKIPRWRLGPAMILVALIAVMLANCALLRSQAVARQRAIEAVDRLHGTYGVKTSDLDWFRRLLGRVGVGEKAFYNPKRVSLGPMNLGYDPEHPIFDTDIEALSEHLAHFSNLEMLDLRGCRHVTDRGIVSLPTLPKLKYLLLGGTSVTDECMKELRRRYHGVKFSR